MNISSQSFFSTARKPMKKSELTLALSGRPQAKALLQYADYAFHDAVLRAKPHSVQNLVDVFVQNDVRKRASTTHAFVRFVFI